MNVSRIVALLAAGIACASTQAACGGEGTRAGTTVTRDSAGILIAENRLLSDDIPVWRLDETPQIDIGGSETDEAQQLFRVTGAARLSDGRIAIVESRDARIRYYDAAGEWIMDVGRPGDGPGEFRSPGEPHLVAGDSVIVHDGRHDRFALISPEGEVTRTWALEPLTLPPGNDDLFAAMNNRIAPVLLLSDGDWIARTDPPLDPNGAAGVHRDEARYFRHGPDGSLIDSIGRFPAWEYSQFASGIVFPTFLPQGLVAPAAAGGFWFGASKQYEIGQFTPDGQPIRIIRAINDAADLPSSRLPNSRARILESYPQGGRAGVEIREAMPDTISLPAYSGLLTDEAGNLWVRDYVWPEATAVTWRVFAADGAAVGRIELSTRLTVHAIGDDWLLATWRDDFDVEHVRLYDLDRTGGA